jgi:hypothetical protein
MLLQGAGRRRSRACTHLPLPPPYPHPDHGRDGKRVPRQRYGRPRRCPQQVGRRGRGAAGGGARDAEREGIPASCTDPSRLHGTRALNTAAPAPPLPPPPQRGVAGRREQGNWRPPRRSAPPAKRRRRALAAAAAAGRGRAVAAPPGSVQGTLPIHTPPSSPLLHCPCNSCLRAPAPSSGQPLCAARCIEFNLLLEAAYTQSANRSVT